MPQYLFRLPAIGEGVAEARVVQALHRVVDVQPVLRAGRALDAPRQQRQAQRGRDGLRQQRLAGAGLALDQQRPLQGDGAVDRGL